jgi:hypothetical protein
MVSHKLLIIDELGFVPLSKTGAELLELTANFGDGELGGVSWMLFRHP